MILSYPGACLVPLAIMSLHEMLISIDPNDRLDRIHCFDHVDQLYIVVFPRSFYLFNISSTAFCLVLDEMLYHPLQKCSSFLLEILI